MSADKTERQLLAELVPDLEAQGYEVFLEPKGPLVPSFLKGFRPDVVALGAKGNLVIEVVRPSEKAETRIKAIAELVSAQAGWQFRVLWVKPENSPRTLQTESVQTIRQSIGQAQQLLDLQLFGAALMVCWASFEALVRTLNVEQFSRPQTPGRIVEILAADGTITPEEADSLRYLANKRNAFVHGVLSTEVSEADVMFFITVLEGIIEPK